MRLLVRKKLILFPTGNDTRPSMLSTLKDFTIYFGTAAFAPPAATTSYTHTCPSPWILLFFPFFIGDSRVTTRKMYINLDNKRVSLEGAFVCYRKPKYAIHSLVTSHPTSHNLKWLGTYAGYRQVETTLFFRIWLPDWLGWRDSHVSMTITKVGNNTNNDMKKKDTTRRCSDSLTFSQRQVPLESLRSFMSGRDYCTGFAFTDHKLVTNMLSVFFQSVTGIS